MMNRGPFQQDPQLLSMRTGAALSSEWEGGWWTLTLDGVLNHLVPESNRSVRNYFDVDFNNMRSTPQNFKLAGMVSALGLKSICGTASCLFAKKLQRMMFHILCVRCHVLGGLC